MDFCRNSGLNQRFLYYSVRLVFHRIVGIAGVFLPRVARAGDGVQAVVVQLQHDVIQCLVGLLHGSLCLQERVAELFVLAAHDAGVNIARVVTKETDLETYFVKLVGGGSNA